MKDGSSSCDLKEKTATLYLLPSLLIYGDEQDLQDSFFLSHFLSASSELVGLHGLHSEKGSERVTESYCNGLRCYFPQSFTVPLPKTASVLREW